MKTKLIGIAAFVIFCIFGGVLVMEKINDQGGEFAECSPKGIEVMNVIALGEDYHSVLLRLDKLGLKYSIWKDGIEVVPASKGETESGPFEILITVNDKKTFGIFIGKRTQIIVNVDASNTVVMRRCNVVLTGP